MIEEMWMIRPQRRSFIGATSARVRAMHELRLSSTSRSQSSSLISSIGCGMIGAGVVDQDVDPAHRRERRVGESPHVVATRHVGDDMGHPHARALADLGRGGLAARPRAGWR